jgi:hypothetical protein
MDQVCPGLGDRMGGIAQSVLLLSFDKRVGPAGGVGSLGRVFGHAVILGALFRLKGRGRVGW